MAQETREQLYELQCAHPKQKLTYNPDRVSGECKLVRATCVDCKQDIDHPLMKDKA